MIEMVQDDTDPDLQFTVKRDDAVVNLNNATKVELKLFSTTSASITNAGHQSCTFNDRPNGLVTYNWVSGDLAEAGVYLGDLVITWASGSIETQPEYIAIHARPKAGTVS